jgi:hypothetical protein
MDVVGMRSMRHFWQRRVDVGWAVRKEVGWGGEDEGVLVLVVEVLLRRRRKGIEGRR